MSKYIEYERNYSGKLLNHLYNPSKPETPLNRTFYQVPTRFGLEEFQCIYNLYLDRHRHISINRYIGCLHEIEFFPQYVYTIQNGKQLISNVHVQHTETRFRRVPTAFDVV